MDAEATSRKCEGLHSALGAAGDGKITAALSSKLQNGEVLGIDSSSEMILFAQKTFPKSLYPNLSFQLMSADKITYNDRFDLAFSNSALHSRLPRHPRFLEFARNSLPRRRPRHYLGLGRISVNKR